MQKEKVPSKQQITQAMTLARPGSDKLDAKVMNMMVSAIMNQFQSPDLYQEGQGVLADYEQIQYAIDATHKYLYDQKNSNLTKEDAQIFAAYLVDKMKGLKKVVDKINK